MSTTQKIEKQTAAETTRPERWTTPAVDIFENQDELLVVADVPGAKAEAVDIQLDQGHLTVTARREPSAKGTTIAAEFRPSSYRRTFVLPQGIDANRIEAKLALGVLTVKLPKSDAAKPRQIQVTAG